MDRKVLFTFLIYYALISILFFGTSTMLTDKGYSSNVSFNASGMSETEGLSSGGFMGSDLDLGRFVAFAVFGIGLPSDTPSWFAFTFGIWQTIISLLLVAFIINSFWSGGS